jgi:hypothetical protein
MNHRLALAPLFMAALALGACRESDQVVEPGDNARVEVTSDPAGAAIFLDNKSTGKVTPDLLRDLIGLHEVLVRSEIGGFVYGFRASVDVKGDSLHRVHGPLTLPCASEACWGTNRRYREINSLRPSTLPNGALFFYDASEKGLYWPVGSVNGYASMGLPLIGALAATRDTFALGIYDLNYLGGRPSPQVTSTADRFTLRQTFWVIPPSEIIFSFRQTIRGIEVEEELIGTSATNDVAFIKLTYRNITNRASYQAMDPVVPSAGITYNWVYLGFGLDADIGTATDDMITYEPSLDMVYMYDMDFQEAMFPPGVNVAPGMVGLRLLQAPAGATARVLNAWPSSNDWHAGAGDLGERFGYGVLSGLRSLAPDLPGQQIGFAPVNAGDYRMSVTAGPITLEPGASASMTVAVILAAPVAGTYTSGSNVNPENPSATGRNIQRIAAALLDKARALVVPE